MSLSDQWAESLGDVELTMLHRTFSRMIDHDDPAADDYSALQTKGEQDVAWAVIHEWRDRWEKQGRNNDHGGVWE